VASPGRVISAAKAIPGGARPAIPPQGGPSIGRISPLAAQLANERGYAAAYGNFLPRPPRTFTEGAFGPNPPILPVPVDVPPEGFERPEARRYEYQISWNLPVGQPGTEGIKLADFGTLKTLADLYSVARTCIQIRKAEIRGLDWDIVPTHDAIKAYSTDKKAMREFNERRAKALKFFKRPDPDYFSFGAWLDVILEEVFVFDALSLLLRPTWGKRMGRGLLGSDLEAVEVISGPTIRPLVGMHGEVPRPPAPAYQQYLYGVPRSDYMTLITQRDIDEGGLTNAEVNEFRGDQMLYLPMVQRRWTPYGFPPVERALIPVMAGLQKQAFQLDYFREGTVPAVYISPGDMNITPNQVRELQDALNAVAGDAAQHHKIIVLPPGSKVDPQRPTDLADQFDEVVMTQVCMAFDVNPMELGLLPRVSTVASPFAAREMAQAQQSIHKRLSTKPLLKYLADIFDGILHRVAGQDDMRFTFEGLDEDSQLAAKTQMLTEQVQYGLRSVDEARAELELQPWQLPETEGPVYFTSQGPMPFTSVPQVGLPASGRNPAVPPPKLPRNPELTPANVPSALASKPGTVDGRSSGMNGQRSPVSSSTSAVARRSPTSLGKAADAELDALVRHIRKGRDPATWHSQFLPDSAAHIAAAALAADPGTARQRAQDIILASGDYEWLAKDGGSPKDWPGWAHDLQLADIYKQRISDAFTDAARRIEALIRAWWKNGTTTRPMLVQQITEILEKALAKVLRKLWREAWHLGSASAQDVLGNITKSALGSWTPGNSRAARLAGGNLEALLATQGITIIKAIATTRMRELAQAIADALAAGLGPDALAQEIEHILLIPSRAAMIAQTEITRVQSAAAFEQFREHGVTKKDWITANDGRVCPVCLANQSEGPIPLDSLFQSGDPYPPGHPRCRCAIIPAEFMGVSLKATPPDSTWGGGYGGGAPAGPAAMNAFPGWRAPAGPAGAIGNENGERIWGHPGADYVRWPIGAREGDTSADDDSEPEPHPESLPSANDGDYGGTGIVHNRPKAWPSGHDGMWPSGGIGMRQPPATSIGVRTGRSPAVSDMHKALDRAKKWLDDAPRADASKPYEQMLRNFPPKAIAWMKGIEWIGPVAVPLDLIDFDAEDRWAASHQSEHVDQFMKRIRAGDAPSPAIGVIKPGHNRIRIVDGHHRTMAYKKLGRPALLYAGFVKSVDGPWDDTHVHQFHSGSSPQNK
jgi:SPP1 gp7 family putative phage head morphogenesis protein